MSDPVLFLSHAGSDTAAARELKQRLSVSPSAQARRLTVWLDKDDLVAGGPHWQKQIEIAIENRATAFAVLVGSSGVVNWVENEVRMAFMARQSGWEARDNLDETSVSRRMEGCLR